MISQSTIQFVGSVLKAVLDVASLIPPVAEAKSVLSVVEDGIQVEEGAYAWLHSSAAADTRANIIKLAADLGIKIDFGADAKVTVSGGFRGADVNDYVFQRTDGNDMDRSI